MHSTNKTTKSHTAVDTGASKRNSLFQFFTFGLCDCQGVLFRRFISPNPTPPTEDISCSPASRLQKDSLETVPKPVTPLSVNSTGVQDQPTEKELAAAKEARIRLGYESGVSPVTVGGRLPTGEEPVKITETEYTPTEKLEPLDDVNLTLENILMELQTKNWQEMITAINKVRRLVVHHCNASKLILESLVSSVLKLMKNLRSSVSKTAVLCFTDMVTHLRDEILPYLDIGGTSKPGLSVLHQLLLKSSNDKHFVVKEVQRTLQSIGEVLDIDKVLELVTPYTQHKNPNVRGKAGSLLMTVVNRMQQQKFTDPVFCRLLKSSADLITDKTPDARESAKTIICKLKTVFDNQLEEKGNQRETVVDLKVTTTKGAKTEDDDDDSYLSYSDDEEKNLVRPMSQWKIFCEQHLTTTQVLAVMKAKPED